jgi:hypothetical protein
MLQSLAPKQWRRKWADAAACAYLGLYETKSLHDGPEAVTEDGQLPRPHVLIEAAPRSWAGAAPAGRAVRTHDARGRLPWAPHLAAIDDVLAALELQNRGETLGRELEHRLLTMMLGQFAVVDVAVPVPVAGVRAPCGAPPHNSCGCQCAWQEGR